MADRQNSYEEDIVVDLDHVRLVCNQLVEMRAWLRDNGVPLTSTSPHEVARNDRLHLARVRLEFDIPAKSATSVSPTQKLIEALRTDFRDRLGWAPTIGRNRVLAHVSNPKHLEDATGPASFIQGGGVTPASIVGGGTDQPDSFIQGGGGTGFPQLPTVKQRASIARRPSPSRGEGVRVGVVDTEFFPHPKLFGSCLAKRSSVLEAPRRSAYPYLSGHATFVAGLIQQQAPAAAIELHHVLRSSDAQASAWDVACRIVELAGRGIDIINLSLGCFTDDDQPPLVLDRAIRALPPHVVVVAAAGNYRALIPDKIKAKPFWPAALDGVVAVGAYGKPGQVATFSANYPWVSAYAAGVDVLSTYLDGRVEFPDPPHPPIKDWPARSLDFAGLATWSGTSFSAATVAGAIAARVIRHGARRPHEALHELLATGGPHVWPA